MNVTKLLRSYNAAFTVATSTLLAPFTVMARGMNVFGAESAIQFWLNVLLCCLRSYGMTAGIRLLYDPAVLTSKRIVVVSNHVNYYDWLVLWSCMLKLKRKNVVFCAKRHRNKGGFGHMLNTCMKASGFIVLVTEHQRRQRDSGPRGGEIATIGRVLRLSISRSRLLNSATTSAVQLIESKKAARSTDSVLRANTSSQTTPKVTDVPVSSTPTLLPPRTRGFQILMSALGESCDAVVDVTLSYSYDVNVTLPKSHQVPRSVRVYMRKLNVTFNTSETDGYARWLREWFVQKSLFIDDLRSGFDVIVPENRRTLTIEPSPLLRRMYTTVPSACLATTLLAMFTLVLKGKSITFRRKA
ncbi:39.8 kDa PlsC phosphate acyltransferase [Spodoptera frugiperda ascovirus 1a]|uniref:39.8 kDa PlsC phosphate acyltransferase n=1 Tax=Spodoptera frugiperda ascovirus 1a TaxID=113370 RepID=Q0E4Y9_SFAVA|nr:39.8 kDa PlsC phosphate acyltransferase [Spodoptera frugiperda ascovirus 1a]CAL44712.1 39.8 kDa PlsC phosphate acyltransferase [Spodoptera frugiperda ascovirus 1a]